MRSFFGSKRLRNGWEAAGVVVGAAVVGSARPRLTAAPATTLPPARSRNSRLLIMTASEYTYVLCIVTGSDATLSGKAEHMFSAPSSFVIALSLLLLAFGHCAWPLPAL